MIAAREILEPLEDLPDGVVHVLGDARPRLGVQRGELLAQVAVDDVLHRRVRAAEAEVVAAQERRLLLPHVHLQVRAEVHVVADANGASAPSVPFRVAYSKDSFPPLTSVPFVSAHTVSPTWNCDAHAVFSRAPFSFPPDSAFLPAVGSSSISFERSAVSRFTKTFPNLSPPAIVS